jgi:hypothetical protein
MVILDIICAIITILAINNVVRNRYWWLVYSLAAFLYTFVRISAHQYGSLVLEVFAIVIGVLNFRRAKIHGRSKNNRI